MKAYHPKRARGLIASLILPAFSWAMTSALAAPLYESGVVTVDQPTASTWRTVTFASPFATAPVVVLGTPTYGDTAPLTTHVRNVTASGFQYQLDEWDYLDGVHGTETLHYVAIQKGSGRLESNQFIFEANATAASVTHAFTAVNFARKLAVPFLLATLQTRNEVDPVVLRYRGLGPTQVNLRAQEEISLDPETDHAAESAGYLVDIFPNLGRFDDPFGGTANLGFL